VFGEGVPASGNGLGVAMDKGLTSYVPDRYF
jgi:hypothetical protein